MIRIVFGSALTALGLGLAAAYAGPGLITGDSGASMMVSSAEHAAFLNARFDSGPCSAKFLKVTPDAKDKLRPSVKIVAFGLRPDGSDLEVAMRDIPGDPGAPVKTIAMLLDEEGRIVSVREQPALQAAASPDACAETTQGAGPV